MVHAIIVVRLNIYIQIKEHFLLDSGEMNHNIWTAAVTLTYIHKPSWVFPWRHLPWSPFILMSACSLARDQLFTCNITPWSQRSLNKPNIVNVAIGNQASANLLKHTWKLEDGFASKPRGYSNRDVMSPYKKLKPLRASWGITGHWQEC